MINQSYKHKIVIPVILLFALIQINCKKLVEIDGPGTSVNSVNIYEKDITAISVLTGIYTKMSAGGTTPGELTSLSLIGGLSSDELTLDNNASANTILNAYYSNTLDNKIAGFEFWNKIFSSSGLYSINAALEGISNSNTLTPKVKNQLIGEAKFMRAFCFFYLVNLYGDVPLVLSTDYKKNSILVRTSKTEVWKQVISDLVDAKNDLSEVFLDASLLTTTSERVRPTKWAATALLARTYLYLGDWNKAEKEASLVIGNDDFKLVSLDEAFKKNSKEAIWQLQPVFKGFNTADANAFIIKDSFDQLNKPFISQSLINSFDSGDQRKASWIGEIVLDGITYNFAYKYKILATTDLNAQVSEYSTVFRLAEQYLIRAEARIQQGNISEGVSDLNLIRARATDINVPTDLQMHPLPLSLPKESALLAAEHERQTELFTEWGHRWFDLKRTSRIDAVMLNEAPKKTPEGTWVTYKQLFPLPFYDLQNNANLIQNSGY